MALQVVVFYGGVGGLVYDYVVHAGEVASLDGVGIFDFAGFGVNKVNHQVDVVLVFDVGGELVKTWILMKLA